MLREVQQQWVQALLDPHRSGDVHAINGGVRPSELAFAVYINNVRANTLNALLQTYPATFALVGEHAVRLAVLDMLRISPPCSGDLGVYGESLKDFIQMHVASDKRELATELARYEWALDQLRRCSREQAWSIGDAATLAPEKWSSLRLALTRQSMLFESSKAVNANRDALLANGTLTLDAAEQLLLVAGDADVNIVSLLPSEWSWLSALNTGDVEHATTMALQVDSQFDLQALLARLLSVGALAQPDTC